MNKFKRHIILALYQAGEEGMTRKEYIKKYKLSKKSVKKLDDYLSEGVAAREGLPSVRYFADKICLSPNYFGDLVKKETGKSAQEYIQLKMIDAAKESLLDPDKTIGQVAGELGFQYPQHFVRFFRRHAGCTPNQYRTRG